MKDPNLMSTEELKELNELVQTLLAERKREEEKRRCEQRERGPVGSRWVRLERVRCGQKRCRKCSGEGQGHGPYWYAYFHEEGKMKSRYLGKTLPEEYRNYLSERTG